jgi:molybdopterin converting factor small subunit
VIVTVRYRAQLRQAVGVAVEHIELDRPCAAVELVTQVAERHGPPLRDLLLAADGRPRPTVLLFVGDEQIGPGSPPLRDGDEVTILSPMAGG